MEYVALSQPERVPEKPIPVAYVGSLPSWTDTNYGSGIVFDHKVEVEVEPWLAKELLRHPEFEDRRVGFMRGKRIVVRNQRPVQNKETDLEEDPVLVGQIPLDNMTIQQLEHFAMRNFGVRMPTSMLKNDMINEVRSLVGLRGRG